MHFKSETRIVNVILLFVGSFDEILLVGIFSFSSFLKPMHLLIFNVASYISRNVNHAIPTEVIDIVYKCFSLEVDRLCEKECFENLLTLNAMF